MQLVLTPELLIEAYKNGLFPMAYSGGSNFVHWVCPKMRGQLDIDDFHTPRSLKKQILKNARQGAYEITIDQDFVRVMALCAEEDETRPETWINDQIIEAFINLHHAGHAHSVEYRENGQLLGGLYGLKIAGAFFGESMFSRTTGASKTALIHLVARLWKGRFSVLDTQFVNDHLLQFGAYEIEHKAYIRRLKCAIDQHSDFTLDGINEMDLVHEFLKR